MTTIEVSKADALAIASAVGELEERQFENTQVLEQLVSIAVKIRDADPAAFQNGVRLLGDRRMPPR